MSYTLEQIRTWPATCSVEQAAHALGVSRPHAYNEIRAGRFPVRVITVGGKRRVVTADILSLLEPSGVTR